MSSEVRFGVLGCGASAVKMCEAISMAPRARLAMLSDERPQAYVDLEEFYGVSASTDASEVLASPEVDAVYIDAPPCSRTKLGIGAAQAGKHVLIEWPLATSLQEADALIAACRSSDVRLGVTFTARGSAALSAARDMIRGGLLGDVIAVRVHNLVSGAPHRGAAGTAASRVGKWRGREQQWGGGVLVEQTMEDLDTVEWVTGLAIRRVYAEVGSVASAGKGEVLASITLRFSNGAIGSVQAGEMIFGREHEDMPGPRIYGTKGQLILSESSPQIYLTEAPEGGSANAWQPLRHAGPRGGRTEMVGDFAEAVASVRDPLAGGTEGRRALEIILSAYESAQTGVPIELGG